METHSKVILSAFIFIILHSWTFSNNSIHGSLLWQKKKHPALQKAGATRQREAHPRHPVRRRRPQPTHVFRATPPPPRLHETEGLVEEKKRAINAPRLSSRLPSKQQKPTTLSSRSAGGNPKPSRLEPRRWAAAPFLLLLSLLFPNLHFVGRGGFDFVFLRAEPNFTAPPCFPLFSFVGRDFFSLSKIRIACSGRWMAPLSSSPSNQT